MIKLDIAQLIATIQEAPPFVFPEMDEGTSYLYNNLYCRLATGEGTLLSELDFNAFDSADINCLKDLYNNVFEQNNYQASNIMNTLRQVTPVCMASVYV